MQVVSILLIGLIIGAAAQFLMPGKDSGGALVTILLGIAGAFLGTLIGRAVGYYEPGTAAGFLSSMIGAMVALLAYRVFKGRAA